VQPLLSLPTVMFCSGLMTLVVAIVLSFVVFYEKRENAIAWWCGAMWMASLGCGLLMFRSHSPLWLGIGSGNAAMLMSYGLVWAGFESFSGRKASWFAVAIGAVIWIAALASLNIFREDMSARIMLTSSIGAVYAGMSALAALRIYRAESLPTALLTFFFYSVHTLSFLVRIAAGYSFPLDESVVQGGSVWMGVLLVQSFVQAVFSTFVFLILVRERSEQRYRLAAEVDSLTGISSRRHFVAETRRTLKRKPKEAVLALLDLDWFKKVNDTYGHLAGDAVLRSFSRKVVSMLQPGMLFGRLGGEEFSLLLPDHSREEGIAFAETIRMEIENLDIHFNGNTLKITTSVGMASVNDVGYDFDHLMAGADNALYLCKEEGRNRTRCFEPVMRLHAIIEAGQESRVSLRKARTSRIFVRSRIGRSDY